MVFVKQKILQKNKFMNIEIYRKFTNLGQEEVNTKNNSQK